MDVTLSHQIVIFYLVNVKEIYRKYLNYVLLMILYIMCYYFLKVMMVDLPLIGSRRRKRVTQMQFYSYRLQSAGRLYQQYIVDQYAKIEQNRLNYLRQNQSTLRTECYQGAVDAIHAGDSTNNIGHCIILPSSFSGGSRQMY